MVVWLILPAMLPAILWPATKTKWLYTIKPIKQILILSLVLLVHQLLQKQIESLVEQGRKAGIKDTDSLSGYGFTFVLFKRCQ